MRPGCVIPATIFGRYSNEEPMSDTTGVLDLNQGGMTAQRRQARFQSLPLELQRTVADILLTELGDDDIQAARLACKALCGAIGTFRFARTVCFDNSRDYNRRLVLQMPSL